MKNLVKFVGLILIIASVLAMGADALSIFEFGAMFVIGVALAIIT